MNLIIKLNKKKHIPVTAKRPVQENFISSFSSKSSIELIFPKVAATNLPYNYF